MSSVGQLRRQLEELVLKTDALESASIEGEDIVKQLDAARKTEKDLSTIAQSFENIYSKIDAKDSITGGRSTQIYSIETLAKLTVLRESLRSSDKAEDSRVKGSVGFALIEK